MEQEIQLALVHHNRLFRECLASVLAEVAQVRVVSLDLSDRDAVLPQLETSDPDVVAIDLNLPPEYCLALVRGIRRHLSSARILALVPNERQSELVDLLEAGIDGCLPEDCSLEELSAAVVDVAGGKSFCSADIAQAMFSELAKLSRAARWKQRSEGAALTTREREVLHCIAQRMSNKQVARKLSVSLYTVKNHVHRILEKLQVSDRYEAVDLAKQRQWLES